MSSSIIRVVGRTNRLFHAADNVVFTGKQKDYQDDDVVVVLAVILVLWDQPIVP